MNFKVYFMLGIAMIFSGLVNAAGGLGDSCSNACDCDWPLACHNGVCSENCYSHYECDPSWECWGRPPYNAAAGGMCGPNNTCVRDLSFDEHCYPSKVCPECDCNGNVVCPGFTDWVIDNIDNSIYCVDEHAEFCSHLGVHYMPGWYDPHYIPDTQNVYLCLRDWNGGTVGSLMWYGPVCSEGYVWDVNINPATYPRWLGYSGSWEEWYGGLRAYGCIQKTPPATEFSSLTIAIAILLTMPAFAYLIVRKLR